MLCKVGLLLNNVNNLAISCNNAGIIPDYNLFTL